MVFITAKQIVEKAYIDVPGLTALVPISKREARNIIRMIVDELKSDGAYIPATRRMIAPTELVLKKLNINADYWNRKTERNKRDGKEKKNS